MLSKDHQLQKFLEVYNNLNEQQQLAVNTIEGPVMVIAGPGTGKTQILSARIGKILLETDTLPQNILCLTYTDAGVVAMRKRLQNFIGPDAYKVNIYTFHAFCNDIIQENLHLFEKNVLDPVSDLERIDLYRRLIDGFGKDHPLKRYRGDVYFEINNLQHLFSTMKREGWTPVFINEKIDEYIKSLPERDEYIAKRATKNFKKGDIRTDKITEETEKAEKLRAAVNEFDTFQTLMRNANRYDFDDMINWVIRAFEEDKNLLARYQERFLYILVDEYQDTSGTQNRLVELLISYWDKPNIFVVGDDDQSIYRFQGANVENMLSFAYSYKEHLLTIVLKNNYRSTQPILDVSKALIDRNNERLIKQIEGLSKDLISSNTKYQSLQHAMPRIKMYETQRMEMIGITTEVEALLNAGTMPGRIAVIFKENRFGEELAHYFKLKNIPVYSKRNLNLLQIPLVQKIVTMLRYLSCEHDIPYSGDALLFEILHFDWFGIPAIEVAKLSIEAAETQFSANRKSLRSLLFEKANTPARDLFSEGANIQLQKASDIIEKLITSVSNVTLQVLFENIIRNAGVLKVIMKSEDKHWLLKVLTALFDFVKEETRRKPLMNIHDLVAVIDLMEKEQLSLPMVQVSGNEKGVNLLTAHGSKGLEYEHVFFAGCNACFWERKRKPGGGYTLPDTLFTAASKQNDEEELRRLFYVALTRSEQHLHISYAQFKNDGKEEEPSMFIAEIQDAYGMQAEKIVIDASAIDAFAALQFDAVIAPEISKLEEEYIGRLLDKFTLNVTALNNYLDCPLRFYYSNLVRIPSPKNEATEFGSAVHYALEWLFRKMKENKDQFPSKEVFVNDFNYYMRRHRESFTEEQYNRRMEYGQTILNDYYDKNISSFNKIVAVEVAIKNVVVNGVPLKGKLDKIEFDGKQVNVVDYKTGNIDTARKKLLAPHDKEPLGGDYWRQAVFYKILVDNDTKGWIAVSSEFDFVEPDKKKEYHKAKVFISAEDITTVKHQITETWNKIQARDFYTGCGKADCHWCNFVKTNELAIALHEIQEEEEESMRE